MTSLDPIHTPLELKLALFFALVTLAILIYGLIVGGI